MCLSHLPIISIRYLHSGYSLPLIALLLLYASVKLKTENSYHVLFFLFPQSLNQSRGPSISGVQKKTTLPSDYRACANPSIRSLLSLSGSAIVSRNVRLPAF